MCEESYQNQNTLFSPSFPSLIYSDEYCFGAAPECSGQIANLRWGMGPCQWKKSNENCQEIQVWGTLPAPSIQHPHSSKGGHVYVTIPAHLQGVNTDGRGRLYNSAIHGTLEEMNERVLKFHVPERLPQRWNNAQIHATWVHSPSSDVSF